MDTIFMNSKNRAWNSGKADVHRFLLSLTDKINLKRSDKICCFMKTLQTTHTKIINLKHQL